LNGTNFSATGINLNPGNNTVYISASNQDGTASDQTTIIYTAPMPAPVVTITSPSQNPFNTNNSIATINANILNVSSAAGVSFFINGQASNNFNFNGNSFTATGISLNQGTNQFIITGTNSVGSDTKSTVINYSIPAPPAPSPIIREMAVSVTPQNGSGCVINIAAGLANVTDISQITFRINNVPTNGFTYSNGVFQYRYQVNSNNPSVINYTITVTTAGGTVTETRSANVSNCGLIPSPNVFNAQCSTQNEDGKCFAYVRARIDNISQLNQIRFLVNGQSLNDFAFTNGIFEARVDLTGYNASTISFVISATTGSGTDSETTTCSLNNCAVAPRILNMNATQSQVRGSFFATVTAQITGIQNNSQIQFLVNGVSITNFTFTNGNFNATNVPVNPGNNTFTIIATNLAGSVNDTRSLTVAGNTGGQQNGVNNSTNTLNGQPVNPNNNNMNNQGGGNNNQGGGNNNQGGGNNNQGGGNKPANNGSNKVIDNNSIEKKSIQKLEGGGL
jgi:hypothetical protein